jgi:hypothetical protein
LRAKKAGRANLSGGALPRRVLDREVVGEQIEALDPPCLLVLDRLEQTFVLACPQLAPGLPEEVVEGLGCPLGCGTVEEPLQREMGCGAPRLVDGGRFRQPVYGAELVELGAGLEIARPAR